LIDFAIAYFKLKEKYGKGASDKQNFVFWWYRSY
jgi:hypothetical protein